MMEINIGPEYLWNKYLGQLKSGGEEFDEEILSGTKDAFYAAVYLIHKELDEAWVQSMEIFRRDFKKIINTGKMEA